jgi:hypothetical protein
MSIPIYLGGGFPIDIQGKIPYTSAPNKEFFITNRLRLFHRRMEIIKRRLGTLKYTLLLK